MMKSDLSERQASSLAHLFRALAVGGRQPVITLEDWEDHLGNQPGLRQTSVKRWYLAALRHEWQSPDPPSSLCALLSEEVEIYLETRPGPWATILGHILRVTGNAVFLAERSQVDPEAACLAALFHDMGKLDEWDTGRPHAVLGAQYAAEQLDGELPRHTIRVIGEAITNHGYRPAPSQKVARVLHDADKLDKIGATGLIRRISKTDNLRDACLNAERTVYEALDFPPPCLAATEGLLRPKLAFTRTIERLLDDACP
jgi:hypothetical protein